MHATQLPSKHASLQLERLSQCPVPSQTWGVSPTHRCAPVVQSPASPPASSPPLLLPLLPLPLPPLVPPLLDELMPLLDPELLPLLPLPELPLLLPPHPVHAP
jgi:hypothetical protein